jgi:fatty-acyl-CoA synthase
MMERIALNNENERISMDMDREMGLDAWLSRQLLLGEVLARYARKSPDSEMIIFGNVRVCYREMDQRVNRLANALLAMGISKGDKIGSLLLNCRELLEIFFAVAKIGAVNVPVNVRLSPREMAYILDNSDTKTLFLGENFIEQIDQVKKNIPFVKNYIVIGPGGKPDYQQYEIVLHTGEAVRPEIWLQDDDDAFILYTAGTTGKPKGAILTHKNVVAQAMNICRENTLSSPRRPGLPDIPHKGLSIAPLFHVGGLMSAIRLIIDLIPFVVINFTPAAFLQTIEKEKVTFAFLVPAMWRLVLDHPDLKKYDVSSLRTAAYGADITPNSLKERILEAFPNAALHEAFGQTEMSATGIMMKNQDALRKEGSVGLPLRSVDVRVVDNDMNDVPTGQVGEIIYRGPGMMKGYYKSPESTRDAFAGGWFHSGDLVRQDAEGFIYIVDRKKDMIKSGGENIYSAEVEAVLQLHPAVKEVAVVGWPDPKWGEVVKAYVALFPGEKTTAEDIVRFCGEYLAKFKRPKFVEFVEALPRSATGKILKKHLRELK